MHGCDNITLSLVIGKGNGSYGTTGSKGCAFMDGLKINEISLELHPAHSGWVSVERSSHDHSISHASLRICRIFSQVDIVRRGSDATLHQCDLTPIRKKLHGPQELILDTPMLKGS